MRCPSELTYNLVELKKSSLKTISWTSEKLLKFDSKYKKKTTYLV